MSIVSNACYCLFSQSFLKSLVSHAILSFLVLTSINAQILRLPVPVELLYCSTGCQAVISSSLLADIASRFEAIASSGSLLSLLQ